MAEATIRHKIITELYNRYQANGFITEDEALAYFVANKVLLSEIDSITEHLLTLGVIIKLEDAGEDDENVNDRSKLDYNEIFDEVLSIQPNLINFIEYIRNIAPPQNREWQTLIPQAKNGNKYAYSRLIEMYLRIVIKQALYCHKKYQIPLEDTIQDGVIGLIIAIKKFDPTEHEKFSTYAPWWISQSISRRMQISSNPMYFPVHVKSVVFMLQKLMVEHDCNECDYEKMALCPAFVSETQKQLDCDVDMIKRYISYLYQWSSLEDFDLRGIEPNDRNECDCKMLELADASYISQTIHTLMENLKPREREVLIYRYGFFDGEPWTLEQIGNKLGITRERVRQIESKALRKIEIWCKFKN